MVQKRKGASGIVAEQSESVVDSVAREGDMTVGSEGLERKTAAGSGTRQMRTREMAQPQVGGERALDVSILHVLRGSVRASLQNGAAA